MQRAALRNNRNHNHNVMTVEDSNQVNYAVFHRKNKSARSENKRDSRMVFAWCLVLCLCVPLSIFVCAGLTMMESCPRALKLTLRPSSARPG